MGQQRALSKLGVRAKEGAVYVECSQKKTWGYRWQIAWTVEGAKIRFWNVVGYMNKKKVDGKCS